MEKKDIDKQDICNTIVYTIKWNLTKSARLKSIHGVSFEELLDGELLDIRENPARKDQMVLIFYYHRHVWAVPFVIEEQGIFLKTLYPSRKYQKLYKKR